jgi:hypothetical protein
MLVMVDSVLLGGAPALKSAMPCWHITIRGRPALMIRIANQELRAQHPRVPKLVVVALGYNSLWEHGRKRYAFWSRRFDHEALALLATLRRLGARQFVWVTLRQPIGFARAGRLTGRAAPVRLVFPVRQRAAAAPRAPPRRCRTRRLGGRLQAARSHLRHDPPQYRRRGTHGKNRQTRDHARSGTPDRNAR